MGSPVGIPCLAIFLIGCWPAAARWKVCGEGLLALESEQTSHVLWSVAGAGCGIPSPNMGFCRKKPIKQTSFPGKKTKHKILTFL